ncbi:MAG: fused MFS/spermidine synthase, partial [Myxococcota bacterium]
KGRFAVFAAVALLCGFAMMAIQTVLLRIGALSFGASQFTFSMVVAVFVLCIALGSLAVSALPRIPGGLIVANLWALVVVLFLLYEPLQDATYWAHVLRSLFTDHPASFYPFQLAAFVAALGVLGLPVALSGATLPLLFHGLRREFGDLGAAAGRLYSWNTLGSFLGALLGGYALLFWMDLHAVFRLAVAALAVAAVLVTVRVLEVGRLAAIAVLLAPVLLALLLLPPWSSQRLAAGLFRMRAAGPHTYDGPGRFFAGFQPRLTIPFYEDDPIASVAVKEERGDDGVIERGLLTNGKPDGSVRADYVTMALVALLPALFAETVERGLVIGYGTGVSVGELAALPSVREVVVAEISPAVLDAAPLFDYGNLDASHQPAVRVVPGDAYRTLLRSEGSFDVIVSEPSNPWVTGVEMLFSREFLAAARDRLTPGGVYAQWFHDYETDAATVAMVLRTYASVFDHVSVWYALGSDLILLGFREPHHALDVRRLGARAALPELAAGLRRCRIQSLPELLAHELLPLGVVHATALPGEIHTLLQPRLSHLAARAFYSSRSGQMPSTAALAAARVGYRNSLLRRYVARRGGRLPEAARTRMADEACQHRPAVCITLLAQWTHEVPDSPGREKLESAIRANPLLGKVIDLRLVEPLSRLYSREPRATDGPDALGAALQATDRFSRYYHHAAPFSRAALAQAWRRCEADPEFAEQCKQARARAEATLGDFATPLRQRARSPVAYASPGSRD